MTRTITAPNLVQSQRWGCDSTSSVRLFPFQQIWATGLRRACPKLWSRTIRWNNASINSAGNWRQYAGFQVEIQKKRGSGCSVPTPALPGANSHWISGEPRGGEQTQTAPLLEMTLKMVAKCSRQKKEDSPTRCTRRTARYSTADTPAERNMYFYFNTHFSSCSLFSTRAQASATKADPGTQPKSRFSRYLWRWGFNWKVTLHVHPGAISGNSRSHRQRRPSAMIAWTVYIRVKRW